MALTFSSFGCRLFKHTFKSKGILKYTEFSKIEKNQRCANEPKQDNDGYDWERLRRITNDQLKTAVYSFQGRILKDRKPSHLVLYTNHTVCLRRNLE